MAKETSAAYHALAMLIHDLNRLLAELQRANRTENTVKTFYAHNTTQRLASCSQGPHGRFCRLGNAGAVFVDRR